MATSSRAVETPEPAGGYPPPPGGGYPPPGSHQPGGFGQPAAPGFGNADDRTFALLAHFGGAAGAFISGGTLGFVAPLIAYLAKGQQSPTVRAHATAALNFQLLWSIIALASYTVSWCLLFVPTLAIVIFQVIVGILGGIKANEGQVYRYPLSYNFIK